MDQTSTQEHTGMTYADIGQELGLTPSAVRKIEQKALRKLRKGLEARGYTVDDIPPAPRDQYTPQEG